MDEAILSSILNSLITHLTQFTHSTQFTQFTTFCLMDLSRIQQYLDYTPFMTGDPKSLMKDILERAHYLDIKQKEEVMKAYNFANKHHANVKRLSGEPYIIHPVKVLEFLMDSNPDVATMQTALLHDVIEDTPVTYEDVKYHFGEEVADLCE